MNWRCVVSRFFASSLDTVSLAPGFGLAWNKRKKQKDKVNNLDPNHVKNKTKYSEKAGGRVNEEPRLWKQLRKSSKKPPLGAVTVLIRPFILLLEVPFSQLHVHSFTSFHTVFPFTQGLHREDADPTDAAPVTIFPPAVFFYSLGSFCEFWTARGNVSPTFFIVIPRSGEANWLAAVKLSPLAALLQWKKRKEKKRNNTKESV